MKENTKRYKEVYDMLTKGVKIKVQDVDNMIGGYQHRVNFRSWAKRQAAKEGRQYPYIIDGRYQMKHNKQAVDEIHGRLLSLGKGFLNNSCRMVSTYYIESNNPIYKQIAAKIDKTLQQMG